MSDSVPRKRKLINFSRTIGVGVGVSKGQIASSSVLSVYNRSAEESAIPKERAKPCTVASVYNSSAEYFELSCDLCSIDGDHVEAEGYCTECNDYLCSSCFRSHTRNKASLHHSILDKDNMPGKSAITCDSCSRIGDNVEAVGFCSDCEEYLCAQCVRNHPKNRASKHHTLLGKASMPVKNTRSLSTSVAAMNIAAESGTAGQQCHEEFTYIRDINVTTAHDQTDCLIIDIAIVSDTELAVIDNNKLLKLVDMETSVVKGYMTFQTEPAGLTALPGDQLAMTLLEESTIQLVSTSGGVLSVGRTLNINGAPVAVDYCNEKLYVSFWMPVKFQILRLTGTVHKTIQPDSKVLEHCTLPRFIAVSPDESSIYISDWKTKYVMCMGMNGNMIARYKHELDDPCAVIFSPSGSLYLCNTGQHAVYKMPKDLGESTLILGPGDGLKYPYTICFNVGKQRLYISSGSDDAKFCNFIKVYQLK